jgi:branched-subunit amino acid transport protein
MTFDWLSWLTVLAAGVVTLLARASFIVLPAGITVPPWLQLALKFVAAAVLPALVLPEVLFRDALAGDIFNIYRIAAATLALIVAWKTRNLFATLGVGLGALWLMQWLLK